MYCLERRDILTFLDLIFEHDTVDDFESYDKYFDFWTVDEDGKYICMTYRTNFKPLFPNVKDVNHIWERYFYDLFEDDCGIDWVWMEEKPVFIEYPYVKKMQITELSIQDKVWHWSALARRPYMRLRGKPVTEEQVFDIVSKTDTFLRFHCNIKDIICFFHLENHWFKKGFGDGELEGHGFVHPNGVIGYNNNSGCKYPQLNEVLQDAFTLITNFPYLDLIYVFTYWDEVPPDEWDKIFDSESDCTSTEEFEGFYGAIELGVHIHDGKVEILDDASASKVYKQYEKLYGVSEPYFYVSSWRKSDDVLEKSQHFDEDFLRRCIEAHGLDFEKTKANIRDYYYPFPKNEKSQNS